MSSQYQIDIYTLRLEGGFYYVGRTRNLERRKEQHFGHKGAEWTRLHAPIEVMGTESFIVSSVNEEDRWENHHTIKMMKQHGWQNVRGGFWSVCNDYETLMALHAHGYFTDCDPTELNSRNEVVYVLKLGNDKYYVGKTRSLKTADKGFKRNKMSAWLKLHQPVDFIEYRNVTFEDGLPNLNLVNEMVLEYGEKVGYENVRGGSFTDLNNDNHLHSIARYQRRIGSEKIISQKFSLLLEEYENLYGSVAIDIELQEGEALYYIYVLELQDGYFHIACSRHLEKMLHKIEKGKGGQWCTLHPPVRLVELIPFIGHYPFDDIEQLDPVVERYFNTYNPQRVRGGRFNMPDMRTHMGRVDAYYEVVDGNYIRKSKNKNGLCLSNWQN